MAFKLPINLNAVAQGVGGLVFGSGDRNGGAYDDDAGVEALLERISDGVLADDRRAAMAELRDLVQDNPPAQLALGHMGFPVLMAVLKEERHDVDMVRGALEVLINGLQVADGYGDPGPPKTTASGLPKMLPGQMNSELFARETGSVSLLLSLLEEEDFYVRYHTVQLLTVLLTNSPYRLQEAILSTPQGVTRLMDMMLEREVIRNEALLLLISLTRANEEIQKIVVFEAAFERLFNIIREEGASDGGIIVQDCIELVNNLLRSNPSNQVFLRETIGLHHIPALLKLRTAGDPMPRQKAANLLCALETVSLLLTGKDTVVTANQTLLGQNKLLDVLVALALEDRVSSANVRAQALRCIGDLVLGHAGNQEMLGSKMVREEADAEPALHRALRVALHSTHKKEHAGADYLLQCYCQGNTEGQTMLASTITPLSPGSHTSGLNSPDDPSQLSFGSMLVKALVSSDGKGDLEASCRAASVLSHILKDNAACKERVLRIPLEVPTSAMTPPDLLMPRCMRYLAAAGAAASPLNVPGVTTPAPSASAVWLQPVLLRLLVTWLADCPPAVSAFLSPPAHLPFLVELTSRSTDAAGVHVAGLSAVLLGICIIFNNEPQGGTDGGRVVDVIVERVGLSKYFARWEDLQKSRLWLTCASASRLPKPLTRATAAAAAAGESSPAPPATPLPHDSSHGGGGDELASSRSSEIDSIEPSTASFYDAEFVRFVAGLEQRVRERVMELFARPRTKVVAASTAELGALMAPHDGEAEPDYIARLKSAVQSQARELEEMRERNAALADELMSAASSTAPDSDAAGASGSGAGTTTTTRRDLSGKAEIEALRQQLQEAHRSAQAATSEKAALQAEVKQAQQLAAKNESDLRALSDAYNTVEQENFRLEGEVKTLKSAASSHTSNNASKGAEPDAEALEAAKEEGREEAQKEAEQELNDLLVCLGQEESKVEKLRQRLEELGEDVDALLETVGHGDAGDDDDDEEINDEDEGKH